MAELAGFRPGKRGIALRIAWLRVRFLGVPGSGRRGGKGEAARRRAREAEAVAGQRGEEGGERKWEREEEGYYKTENGESSNRKTPKKKTKSSKKKKKESKVVCYKCGKPGHYANRCRVKQQIQALSIDENLKESLIKIFLNDSEPEDLEVKAVDYTSEKSSSESDKQSECDGNCDYHKSLCTLNGLCVLIKEEDLILGLIDKIEDQEERRNKLKEYLTLYKDKSPLEKKIEEKKNPYDLKEIMEKIKEAKIPREPTIKELRQEINSVKTELHHLKERVVLLKVKNESPLIAEQEEEEEDKDMSSKAPMTPSKRTHEVSPPPPKMVDKLREDAYAVSIEANNAKDLYLIRSEKFMSSLLTRINP
ncbi:uncharacterized protein LOC131169366 [Hevea brasiliensis]|uniref:uncharacterized protein LOC131169366 n=1 Tax=Hevea brasiliensis TaxID=3981 RepID=UPI0025D1DE6B|nr:uncharacterized protein LOC131169366 [Hevea brasiliensis]